MYCLHSTISTHLHNYTVLFISNYCYLSPYSVLFTFNYSYLFIYTTLFITTYYLLSPYSVLFISNYLSPYTTLFITNYYYLSLYTALFISNRCYLSPYAALCIVYIQLLLPIYMYRDVFLLLTLNCLVSKFKLLLTPPPPLFTLSLSSPSFSPCLSRSLSPCFPFPLSTGSFNDFVLSISSSLCFQYCLPSVSTFRTPPPHTHTL